MLNPFPQLFTFADFGPTVLRLAAALVFVYLAYAHYKNRASISRTHFPVIGAQSFVWVVGAVIELLVAAALFFGYWTQWASLVGALIGLKYAFWAGKYESYFVLSRTAMLLIFAICLSLLLTGAGQYAWDIRL